MCKKYATALHIQFSDATQTPASSNSARIQLSITAITALTRRQSWSEPRWQQLHRLCGNGRSPHHPVGPGHARWLSRVGEGSPTLCQTCTTALQALVRVVYLVLMLRLLRVGVCGRWCSFKRNPPSCWAFGCQTAKPLSNERPNRPRSPATVSPIHTVYTPTFSISEIVTA